VFLVITIYFLEKFIVSFEINQSDDCIFYVDEIKMKLSKVKVGVFVLYKTSKLIKEIRMRQCKVI